jgi:AraC family transcriptional regulator
MEDGRTYGDAVARSFGLTRPPTLATRALRHEQVAVSRLSIGANQLGFSAQIPPEDTFVAAVYLTQVPYHELWSANRPYLRQGYAPRGMRIVNLQEEFSANIFCPHETLTIYIPRTALDAFTEEADGRRVESLVCTPGLIDPIVSSIVDVLLPALDRPDDVSALFAEHAVLTVSAHLAHVYGGSSPRPMRGGALSAAQLRLATAALADLSRRDISMGEIAQECGLPRAYFAKAFKASTGLSLDQWRHRYRVECAKRMLADNGRDIAEVALACGFSDQSHLTRIFSRWVGVSPGRWRRSR